MDRETLHQQISKLMPRHGQIPRAMLLHALVELGIIEVFECQYEDCVFPSREFFNDLRRIVSVDHKVPHTRGGSHRPENLSIMHAMCNAKKGNGRVEEFQE